MHSKKPPGVPGRAGWESVRGCGSEGPAHCTDVSAAGNLNRKSLPAHLKPLRQGQLNHRKKKDP